MVPWLLVQGILGLLLAGLALYYLIIFPDKADCMPYTGLSHQGKAVKNQNYPHQVMKIFYITISHLLFAKHFNSLSSSLS